MKRILVVEDDAIIAKDLQRSLSRMGYSVPLTARSGKEALEAVEQSLPALILMDIGLKGPMDGIEVAHRIRQTWDVPILFLTSYSDEVTLQRAKATGPYGYLVKPFRANELRIAIEVGLHKHSMDLLQGQRERWYATTLESIGDAVIATDAQGKITFMNAVAVSVTGWAREEALGRSLDQVFRLLDERGQPMDCPVGKAVRHGFAVQLPLNTQLLAKEGNGLDVDDSASPIIDVQGQTLGGVVVFRDISARKRMEERLTVAERMASIGTMAAGMAHEINNPLAAVLGNVSLALESLRRLQEQVNGRDAVLAHHLSESIQALQDADLAGERIIKTIADLKRLSRLERIDSEYLDLPDVLEAAIKVSEHQLRHHARLERCYGTTPFVSAPESQLVQVFTNLLVNAAQAIGEGRTADNRITVSTFSDESGSAVVQIDDSGPGISKSDLKRIFDPFFSSKPMGLGMGLGLSICHNIIASLQGEITVDSTPGVGTTFRVTLPPAPAPGQPIVQVAASAPEAEPVAPTARILVIDDEPVIRRLVARVLQPHQVVAESGGRQALAHLDEGERFDLILCDLMMPEMTGAEVFRQIQEKHPAMQSRVVFLSGGAFSPSSVEFLESVTNATLSKPFTVQELRSLVAEYLAKAPNARR